MTVWPLENVLEAFEKRRTLKNIFKILIRRIFNLIWRDVFFIKKHLPRKRSCVIRNLQQHEISKHERKSAMQK